MAAIHDLLRQIDDTRLKDRIQREWDAATRHKKFGLVFERHLPELLTLPGIPPRRGDLVALKGSSLETVWRVATLRGNRAKLKRIAEALVRGAEEEIECAISDLVVIRQFGDAIYPTLTAVDSIQNGEAEGPWHILLEADNYHALQLLEYAYRGRVDCIYIDPPYNSGARDWKYNNSYIDENDSWRHSKWLSFMEKRLRLAKRLLNPESSTLIVTIDEKEYLRLGLLLEEIFAGAKKQMVSSLINPAVVPRAGSFGRSDEYIFFVMLGKDAPGRLRLKREWVSGKGRTHTGRIRWDLLRRSGPGAARSDSPGGFYPIYVDPAGPKVVDVGEPLPDGVSEPPAVPGTVAILPIRKNRTEGRWQWGVGTFRERWKQGRVRITGSEARGFTVSVLKDGEYAKVQREEFQSLGLDANGTLVVAGADAAFVLATPGTQWRISSHDATQYGTRLLTEVILPGSNFPFPKSLYAVADTLRFFVEGKPSAIVLDFFAGSGTTLNAINLLNSLDGGKRQCVMVTNNEVSADEAAELSAAGLKPGDPTWETQGICRSITWPRSKYTILGRRDDGTTIDGEYLTGRPVSTETPRQFTHVAFVSPADFRLGKGQTASTARKRKQGLVSLIDGLPQSAVGDEPYIASEDYPASILFDPEKAEEWLTALDGQDHIERFYIVTERPSDYRNLRERVEDLLGPKVVQEERKLPMSAGFSSNLAYFKLDFLDKNRVELGAAFREILPLLWLKSGSVGQRPELGETTLPHWFAPAGSPFAVLLKESQVAGFLRELVGRTDLTHVFIVTDSEEAFRTLSEEVLAAVLPFNAEVETFQLYRDYLSNFAINTSPEDAALPEVHG